MRKKRNTKINKRRLIFIILTVLWMTLIFVMSHRPADESSQDSYNVGRFVCSIFVPDFDDMTEEQQMDYAKGIDHPVRKIAHFMEYFILGALLVGAIVMTATKKGFIISWLMAMLYAISDEVHQIFIPGRNGNITDVMIDSSGALLAVICLYFIISKSTKDSKA